jgi:hypothetical protein
MSVESIILTCMAMMGGVGLYLLSGIRSELRDTWSVLRKLEERLNDHINDHNHKEKQ